MPPGPQILDLGNPVSGHPDNSGLSLLLLGLPEIPRVGGGSKLWPDLSGKGAGGTLTNGPTWAGTPFGQAGVSFDKTNDYIACPTGFSLNPPCTMLCWVKPTAVSGIQWFFGGSTTGMLLFGLGGTSTLHLDKAGVLPIGSGNTGLTAGAWQHVAASYDLSGNFAFYLNGKPDGTGTNAQTIVTTGTLQFGVRASVTDFFGGVMAGMTGYNRVLSADAVARIYEWSQNPTRDPRLRRYTPRAWSFGGAAAGGGGTTYSDSVSEAATATDAVTDTATMVASNAEAATAVDAVTSVATLVASVAEAGAGAETITDTAVLDASVVEACTAVDTITNGNVYASSCSEAADAIDAVIATAAFVESLAESVTAADAASASAALAGSITEAAAAADAPSAQATFLEALTEAVDSADVALSTGIFNHSVTEAATATDSFTANSGSGTTRIIAVKGYDTTVKKLKGYDTTVKLLTGAA